MVRTSVKESLSDLVRRARDGTATFEDARLATLCLNSNGADADPYDVLFVVGKANAT